MIQKILLSFLLISSTACLKVKEHHGYEIVSDDIAKIIVNTSTKEEIIALLGNPLYVDNINDDKWFYLGYISTHEGLLTNKVKSYDAIILYFKDNIVVKKEFKQHMQAKNFVILSDKTKVQGDDDKILHNLFSNFGKYRRGK